MKLNVAGENKEYKEGLTVKELIALENVEIPSQRRLPSKRISEQIPWICLKWSCPSRTPAAWKSRPRIWKRW